MAYIGKMTDGPGDRGTSADWKYASRYQASSSFTAVFMSARLTNSFGSGEYARFAIYADSSGSPGALLGQTGTVEGTGTEQWFTSDLQSGVSITNGNYYWLTVHSSGSAGISALLGLGTSAYNADTFSDGPADPFGSKSDDSNQYDIYASDEVKVQIASGGNLAKGGAVVESSGGNKVAAFVDGSGNLAVYEDIDGTPSLIGSAQTPTAAFGNASASFSWVHAAINASNVLHVVAANATDNGNAVVYNTVSNLDSSPAWSSWTTILAAYNQLGLGANARCWIGVDSNGYRRVLYIDLVKITGGLTRHVYYNQDTGSGWGTPEQVNTANVKLDHYDEPKGAICPADDVEAIFRDFVGQDLCYRRRNGTWGTENEYAHAATLYPATVTVTSGDTVYRAFVEGVNIRENTADTGYDVDSGAVCKLSAALDGTDRYLFYIDGNADVHYITNTGSGWTDGGVLQTGTYLRVIAEWAYNHENQSGEINYIFEDASYLYYGSLSLGGGVKNFSAVLAAATSTPSATLGVIFKLAAVLAAASSTPDSAVLEKWISFAAALAAATATPDTVVLERWLNFAAVQGATTTTPDTATLAVARALAATLAAGTTTPDTAMLGLIYKLAAALQAQTSTPDDVALGLFREFLATIATQTTTPDTAALEIVVMLAAALQAATSTPDTVPLAVVRELAATLATGTTTPDTVPLSLVMEMLATLSAVTTTPDVAVLGVTREMLAAMAAQTVTPDTVALEIVVLLAAALAAQTTTPDAALAVIRLLSAGLGAVTVTPDAVLAVVRPLAASLDAISATPDAVLSLVKELAATLAAQTTTPDDATLELAVIFAAALGAVTVTPDSTALAVTRPLAAALQAATTTPDAVLAVARALSATLAVTTSTPSAALTVTRLLAAIAGAVTVTPDDVELGLGLEFVLTVLVQVLGYLGRMRVGDVGTPIRVLVTDQDGKALNVSAAATRTIYLRRPDGVVLERAAVPVNTGTDGLIQYVVVEDDLSVAGRWQVRGRVVLTGQGAWYTDTGQFWVEDNL